MARRKRRIPLEMQPLGECTLADIFKHIQTRDQIICVAAAVERSTGAHFTFIDKCAYSGDLFELTRNIIQAVKDYHAEEGKNAPSLDDDDDDD